MDYKKPTNSFVINTQVLKFYYNQILFQLIFINFNLIKNIANLFLNITHGFQNLSQIC